MVEALKELPWYGWVLIMLGMITIGSAMVTFIVWVISRYITKSDEYFKEIRDIVYKTNESVQGLLSSQKLHEFRILANEEAIRELRGRPNVKYK